MRQNSDKFPGGKRSKVHMSMVIDTITDRELSPRPDTLCVT